MKLKNEHGTFSTAVAPDDLEWTVSRESITLQYEEPISTICIGKDTGVQIGVDKKFNWFQKKMIKWCFGFEVKENK